MTLERIAATRLIDAPPDAVFALLANPSAHTSIDGTGWVREPVDREPLSGTGQTFRMAMYHDNHPNKDYEMTNRVEMFERPSSIAWLPGTQARHMPGHDATDDDMIHWGGWLWRYDLEEIGGRTRVTLTYDWSQVPPQNRDIEFPPFPPSHLDESLRHLAELSERG